MLNRSWSVKPKSALAYVVGNRATYSQYVHAAAKQAAFHARRKWITDQQAIQEVVKSGKAKRIIVNAIVARLKGR